MKRLTVFAVCMMLAGVALAGDIGSTNITYGSMNRLDVSWGITTNGTIEKQLTNSVPVSGEIERVVINANDTTNFYDLSIIDVHGIDVLAGMGADVSNVLFEAQASNDTNLPIAVTGALLVRITNYTGAASTVTGGTFSVYYR